MVKKLLKALRSGFRCLLGTHFYHPQYQTLTISPHKARQYTCVHCGAVTDWMAEAEHERFLKKENPRWTE